MARREDVGTTSPLDGEAQRMVDRPTLDLVVAREAREDGKAGRIG